VDSSYPEFVLSFADYVEECLEVGVEPLPFDALHALIDALTKSVTIQRCPAHCTFPACSSSTRSETAMRLTGKWVKARYRAERDEIAARYATWEIIGEPEIRRPVGGSFNPCGADFLRTIA
jgi:hypothetical protein